MSTNVAQQSGAKDTPRSHPPKSPSRLFRKLTTKFKPPTLRPPTLNPKSANPETASPPKSPTQPSNPRSAVPIASADAAAVKRRQAALQQCGLVPLPRKDLSQLEAELDQRYTRIVVIPQDQQDQDELSSAEKIRREWQAKNEAVPETPGDGPNPKDPKDVPCESLLLENPGSTANAEEPKSPDLPVSPSSDPPLSSKTPFSLSPIQETLSIPELPEEDIAPASEGEKKISLTPPLETADPLTIPLPDSPLPSSTNLPDLPPPPPPRENKRLPPIVVDLPANDDNEAHDQVTRGRTLNRDSPQSLASKPSLPALSPTMTASSSSSLPTPRDDESRERMETAITLPGSLKPRSSRSGKVTHARHRSEELGIVHETIHESPELTVAESQTWDPNRESNATMGSAGFEAFVEKRQKRRMSTGFFAPIRRSSGSIRSSTKSVASDFSSMWSAIANDFSLKPLDGGKSRSSTLQSSIVSVDEKDEHIATQPQSPNQQKMTRSRSVIASLGFKKNRRTAQTPHSPSPATSPVRRPTIKIVENRENLIQEVKGIEDDESRRLTEMAFMDF